MCNIDKINALIKLKGLKVGSVCEQVGVWRTFLTDSAIFSVFLHHLLNFRRHNIRRQQLEDVGRRRSFAHISMLDGSSRDAVLADKFRLRHAADSAELSEIKIVCQLPDDD